MKIHELQVIKTPSKRRDGRGISAGRGKTAGRGTKGQKSRAGSTKRAGFEGGQTPLMQRLPKLRGFTSHRAVTQNVSTSDVNELSGVIDNFALFNAGLISDPYSKVKLLLKDDISKKLTVKLQAASASAIASIQAKDGTFTKVEQVKRPSKEKETKAKK